jgi:hypothetical protein
MHQQDIMHAKARAGAAREQESEQNQIDSG